MDATLVRYLSNTKIFWEMGKFIQIKQRVINPAAVAFVAFLWVLSGPAVAQASDLDPDCPEFYFNVLAENDLYGGGSDKHFTQGTRFSFVERRSKSLVAMDEKDRRQKIQECMDQRHLLGRGSGEFIQGVTSFGRKIGEWTLKPLLNFDIEAVSFVFGQDMFTPEDITRKTLIADDRPFAGWLYFGWGFITQRKPIGGPEYQTDIFDSFEFDLGIVGPEAYAGEIQDWWHRNVSNSPRPGGWQHQLKNEPGILMTLERKWRMPIPPFHKDNNYFQFDLMPNAIGTLGNVFTYAGMGAILRMGHNLQSDYGPPRNRPGAQGSDFFPRVRKGKFYWYFFFGVEGRVVVRNVFLDGNTFTDSHRVDKKGFVGDLHMGFVVACKSFRLALTEVIRSREFENQKEQDEFGGISISFAW